MCDFCYFVLFLLSVSEVRGHHVQKFLDKWLACAHRCIFDWWYLWVSHVNTIYKNLMATSPYRLWGIKKKIGFLESRNESRKCNRKFTNLVQIYIRISWKRDFGTRSQIYRDVIIVLDVLLCVTFDMGLFVVVDLSIELGQPCTAR